MGEPDASIHELIERFLEEQPADVEAFLRRYPEQAAELRQLLPTIGDLGAAARVIGEDPEGASETRLPAFRARASDEPARSDDAPGSFVTRLLARVEEHGYRAGRFRVEQELARGGQGIVLEAWDQTLQRRLAMKVALAQSDAEAALTPPEAVSLGRFLEEAQVTAQLDHPGIVPVHDLGRDEAGRIYFTMKLVRGRDLRRIYELVRTGEEGWNRTRALGVLLKVCEAMAYAHSKGVIHRDLKPSNVMVGKFGEVYVMDWGLARALGHEDRKDLRIQVDATEPLRSARHGGWDVQDSPLVTMDGDVVGTPAFMSPEQARGEIERMGPHSDVYAVGAMLYQLLTDRMPYDPSGARLGNRAIWAQVQAGPPEPVQALAPKTPPELEAICDRAMARDVVERYADMRELADDLRAYLEHRVVSAHRTGALVELKKWVQRNRALATSIGFGMLAIVAGLVTSLALKARADAERADVLRLSALQKMQDLEHQAHELWPAWPDKLERYDAWLRDARALVASLDPNTARGSMGHRARLAELEARALPYTDEDRAADRRSHPRFGELAKLEAQLAAARKAQAVRQGRSQVEEVVVEAELLAADPRLLESFAWPLVLPERTEFGAEARGLALARLAVAGKTDDPYQRAVQLRTLSCALQACGLDTEALQAGQEAVRVVPDDFKEVFQWDLELVRRRVEDCASGAPLVRLEGEIATLTSALDRRRTWRFQSDEDRWWHAQLASLVAELENLADPECGLLQGFSPEFGLGVARRREWAAHVEELTVTGPESSRRWSAALASIADRAQCPAYAGLSLRPQLDLVPIGRDPSSGLWEFGHPLTGTVPSRDEHGDLVLTEETGLVFVLIPGGTFLMGAQAQDPAGANHDPEAQSGNTPLQQVVAPFFLSKYEMTQGQWERFTGRNPSYYSPQFNASWNFTEPFTLLHPVEGVSWTECMRVCERMAMALPSEAQWEYATRAGTTTAWWTGDARDSLVGAVNLADRSAGRFPDVKWPAFADWPELDDGYPTHAPIGRFAANSFGLHDVCGNVMEWCRNAYEVGNRDPELSPSASRKPAIRGGSYQDTASRARSAARDFASMEFASHTLGLRPARELVQ
jgi:formylglycine-generating enzyme required for sulfatase activity/serine/threonine protein kinase